MERQEAARAKLEACLDVTFWALRSGFDETEVRMAWASWLDELIESLGG